MIAYTEPRASAPPPTARRFPAALLPHRDRRNHASRAQLLGRVRAAFSELPRLRVTEAQAARLFGLAVEVSRRVLATLAREGFLWQGADGQYAMRAGH